MWISSEYQSRESGTVPFFVTITHYRDGRKWHLQLAAQDREKNAESRGDEQTPGKFHTGIKKADHGV